MNENEKFIKELEAIITYFKLVYVEEITKAKSVDAFSILGGVSYLNRVINDANEKHISLENTNLHLVQSFNDMVEKFSEGKISASNIVIDDLRKLDWLSEIVEKLNPMEKASETICKSCSYDVYKSIIKGNIKETHDIYDYRNMSNKCDKILSLTKKLK